jgi:hypothetical protein
MASLNSKVKKYLEANSKTWNNERNNFVLQNVLDEKGDYIHTWNVSGLSKPTDEQLATYESSATTEENNNSIRSTRKSAYGDIGDQLDEIFKNIDDWKTRIQSIKDANPKE